jgi:hypothetical protein
MQEENDFFINYDTDTLIKYLIDKTSLINVAIQFDEIISSNLTNYIRQGYYFN